MSVLFSKKNSTDTNYISTKKNRTDTNYPQRKTELTPIIRREGDDHTGLGQAGFATACGPADGIHSLYVLAAVCAATGAMSAVIMPTLNTEVVNLFLEQFSRSCPPGCMRC